MLSKDVIQYLNRFIYLFGSFISFEEGYRCVKTNFDLFSIDDLFVKTHSISRNTKFLTTFRSCRWKYTHKNIIIETISPLQCSSLKSTSLTCNHFVVADQFMRGEKWVMERKTSSATSFIRTFGDQSNVCLCKNRQQIYKFYRN